MFPFERRENIHGARTRGNAARRRGNVQHPTGILAPDTEKHFDRNATRGDVAYFFVASNPPPRLSLAFQAFFVVLCAEGGQVERASLGT